MSDTNPAGWQSDPTGRHDHRYWDGSSWTDNVSDAGVAGTDPFTSEAPTPPADTTAAWPTTPGAPVPPAPHAATGGSGGGGSKKGLLIGGGILLVVVVVIAALAFGGDDKSSKDDVRAQLVAALSNESQGGLKARDAECVADSVIGDVDIEVLRGIDYTAADAPQELQSAVLSAYASCNIDVTGGTGSGDTTTTSGSTDEATTTTETTTTAGGGLVDPGSLPDNFEQLLADTYENQLGLPRAKAECLAGKLADAIQSGSLTEQESASAVFDYLSACDISLDEVGAN